MSDISVKKLQEKVDRWHSLRAQVKELEDQASEINKTIAPLTAELVEIMEAMELKRFEGTLGKINLITVDYVNNPATDEDRQAFYQHLKEEGIFEEMVSVHHQRLNSYYKSKLEEAEQSGSEFHIPGLEPKQRKEIRKGR